jgi:hypothetical protein
MQRVACVDFNRLRETGGSPVQFAESYVVEPGYIGGMLLDIKKAGLSPVRGRKEK